MPLIKFANAQGGSDARYHATDAASQALIDSDGRPLGAEPWLYPDMNTWTDGLPGAREMGGSGGGGGGGGVGDLTASPYFQQARAQVDAANAADLSGVKEIIQRALIQLGLVPEGFQDKYGALDDTIKQLIQQNTDTGVSQYARLLQGKDDARRQAIQSLAARGLSHSGAKGFNLRRGTLDFNRNLSDAVNAVLGNINQAQSAYATRQTDRLSGLSAFLAQLAANFRPATSYGRPSMPSPPSVPQAAPAPSYSAPGFQSQYNVGQVQPSGYQIPTGGGFYTNQQTGDLTAKWQRLAGTS